MPANISEERRPRLHRDRNLKSGVASHVFRFDLNYKFNNLRSQILPFLFYVFVLYVNIIVHVTLQINNTGLVPFISRFV